MHAPTPADFGYCPVLAEMLRVGTTPGANGAAINSGAMATPNGLAVLRNIHLETRAARTLEIGLRTGGSCLVFAQTHADLGHAPTGQHVAMDPFQRETFNEASGLLAVERAGLSGYLDFREQFSALELPKFVEAKRQFDLIFVDGSHNFEDVFVDAYFSAQLLRDDGVVLFDDAPSPHVAKVLCFIRSNMRHCLHEISLNRYRHRPSMLYRAIEAASRATLVGFRRIGDFPRYYGYGLKRF